MKTKKMLISIGIILGFAGSFFAKGAEAIGTKTIEPVLVFEYKFDEPIVDVIFDEATMTVKEARALGMRGLEGKKVTETVSVPYPRALITKRKPKIPGRAGLSAIKFLDRKGKVIEEVQLSEKNNEYPVRDIDEKPKVPFNNNNVVVTGGFFKEAEKEGVFWYLKWIDGNTKKVVKIEKVGGEGDAAIISGNGRYIVVGDLIGYGGREDCILYDINGDKLWTIDPIDEFGDYAHTTHILYDGKVLIAGKVEKEDEENKGRIMLINTNGKKLWEYVIEETLQEAKGIGNFEILSTIDGKTVVYVSPIRETSLKSKFILYCFDKNGNLLWEPKVYKGFENRLLDLSLSKKSHFLCGYYSGGHPDKREFWVMDINNGNILWKSDKISGVIFPDGKYLLAGDALLDPKTGQFLKKIEGLSGSFLDSDYLWRIKDSQIEIFDITDILRK